MADMQRRGAGERQEVTKEGRGGFEVRVCDMEKEGKEEEGEEEEEEENGLGSFATLPLVASYLTYPHHKDPGHLVTRNECTSAHSVLGIVPLSHICDIVHEGWPPKGNREVELKLRGIQSSIGTRIRCGFVDKASSRRAENPVVGSPEGKRPLGRPRHRWEDNIKMDLREMEYNRRDWINLAEPMAGLCEGGNEPAGSVKVFCKTTDSSAVAAVKSLPSEQLLDDILFIDSNFKIVSKSITLLESSNLQLSEALNIVDKVSQTVIQNNNSLISEKVKSTRLFSIDEIGDSEMVFGEMRPRIRHRLPGIHLMVGKNLGKTQPDIGPSGDRTRIRAQLQTGRQEP
ncbi:hypothetical protein ANN_05396 [Periplaneta americana]|uniref:Uncharacterized protein n=1 Tax=Periplaneta americana TaxID=6978 RepID=A0ABQ8TCB3_PERAM|nr:hypothetical protein ANN_05396 [Periplaneta americana]